MALFNKLFFSSSNKRKTTIKSNQSPQLCLSNFPFDSPHQVRIVLYRECDRGRRLLFDSGAIKRISMNEFNGASPEMMSSTKPMSNCKNKNNQPKLNKVIFGKKQSQLDDDGFIDISNGFAYKHSRPNASDISSIGEMIFGALAMSFHGTALKVHWLQSPARVLCSQVFLSPVHEKNILKSYQNCRNLNARQSISSENSSIDGYSIHSSSYSLTDPKMNLKLLTNPLDVPDGFSDIKTLPTNHSIIYETNNSNEDSGYSGTTTSTNNIDLWQSVSQCPKKFQQYSNRSSMGSVLSDPFNISLLKSSIDSNNSDYDNCSTTASIFQSKKSNDGCIERRIYRNKLTSFENHNSMSDFIGFIGDNYQTTTNGGSDSCVSSGYSVQRRPSDPKESRSNPEMCRQNKNIRNSSSGGDTWLNIFGPATKNDVTRISGRRAKLGLAVCITMTETFEKEMEQFICEHIALLESMLCRLRASVENAYINHKNFFQIMLKAWQSTAEWIADLFTAPRLKCPVWLNISSVNNKNSKNLAENFMKEFCWLLKIADTKDTNFFISTMLTAILTHHLGWVSTVFVLDNRLNSDIKKIIDEKKLELLEIANHHPYNALWAQLGDLYGAMGSPAKISRTIVYGNEKNIIGKILHILTYFIRCGEVRRSRKTEYFDKESIIKTITENNKKQQPKIKKIGLKRTETCQKNLNQIKTNYFDINSEFVVEENIIDNEIKLQTQKTKDNIKLTVTTPENIVLPFYDTETLSFDSVVEAIEMPIDIENNQQSNNKNCDDNDCSLAQKLFWNFEPKVREGLSWKDLEKLQLGIQIINRKLEKRSNSLAKMYGNCSGADTKSITKLNKTDGNGKKFTSLSDLLTLENINSYSEQLQDDEKIIKMEPPTKENGNGVVFVLGDNEKLVNIKKSNEDIPLISSITAQSIPQLTTTNNIPREKHKHTCNHHKKHSGVKFNFEQYPQIATNYMKNKNIDLTTYDFYDKSTKFELNGNLNEMINNGASSSTFNFKSTTGNMTEYNNQQSIMLSKRSDSFENCEYCNSGAAKTYQTPSNATDFESDDNNYPSTSTFSTDICHNSTNLTNIQCNEIKILSDRGKQLKKMFQKQQIDDKKQKSINLIELPSPIIIDEDVMSEKLTDIINKTGFIPSLFVGVNDHYIPDMILQGTSSPPHIWENNLKSDLTLSSHCASLISMPTENIAIIADMEKWEVKIVSSQTNMLPYTSSSCGPVGMSQLVLTMVETVYAMSNSGISAYECLSYLESKLKEIYVQSEVLAAFLLATEFCSLSAVTSALNLSENDVPLLLSIASIHTPQVTKKYGISFR